MVIHKAPLLATLALVAALMATLLLVRIGSHDRGWGNAKTQMQLDSTKTAFRLYYEVYGNVPQGDLRTIMAVFSGENRAGENPKRITFREIGRREINRRGEWVDQWGTPIVLIRENPTNIFLKSFGRNKRDDGGTLDDLAVSVTLGK